MTKLGQHFLKNKKIIRKIINTLELKEGDVVIEIGPGHGELTEKLKTEKEKLKIIAIEKDKKLAEELAKNLQFSIINFQSISNFKFQNNKALIIGDALKILPDLITNYQFPITNYKIVGNIPYYITGHLLRIIGELEKKPSLIVLTIQKEVAERIVAETPKMNLLAAAVQFWAIPEIIDYVPKEDFSPQPKVDSAVIKLTTNKQKLKTKNAGNYYKLIKILFKQPRKTILNNLSAGFNDKRKISEILDKTGIKADERPQNLGLETIKKLLGILYN